MSRRLLYAAFVVGLAIVAAVTSALPAGAEQRTFSMTLPNGDIVTVTADCPTTGKCPGAPASTAPTTPTTTTTTPTPPPSGGNGNGGKNGGKGGTTTTPQAHGGGPSGAGGSHTQGHSGSTQPAPSPSGSNSKAHGKGSKGTKKQPMHNSNGVPTPNNPTFFNALPGPSSIAGVPNFVIQKFKVPIFLLPIYQAAGIQYGIRWEVLAAINEIETDYGRNLNVSSAGALGWMQFMPATWRTYGTDGNKDGKRDPYNPVDAIFAAARYLNAAGASKDLRRAIFAYNHAGWYVDSVMLRARLIAGYPPDFVGSLTGLTEGRFPVAAHAKYADDAAARAARARVKAGQNAAQVISASDTRRGIDIYTSEGAPVVATNDGIIKEIGNSTSKGHYIVLQDVYGNQYTYSQLGSVQSMYPVPKQDATPTQHAARAISARTGRPTDPAPKLPASAGTQSLSAAHPSSPATPKKQRAQATPASGAAPVESPAVTYKARLFAHPQRPGSRRAGGLDQVFAGQTGSKGFTIYDNYFAGTVGLNAKNAKLLPLKKGSRVVGGTLLAKAGKTDPKLAPHVYFEIRPAGKGAPMIDPKPILDGWKLLESTAIYRASGKNALYGDSAGFSIGQVLLLPKPLLIKRVLSDPRVKIYPGGRSDVKTGQIDRRVLATLEYLSESGLAPTVSSLKSGHSDMTKSGNVSEHSSGDAVDISQVNGIPIVGHQDAGGIAEQTVKRLMLLQGTMAPHQIISLLSFGANTMAMPDHADHIHVGFHPLFGNNAKLGAQAAAILKPGQWDNLVKRLNTLPNPVVPTSPSKYAIPARGGKSGD